MAEQHSFRPDPKTHSASKDRKRAVSAEHMLRQSHLLAAPREYARLLRQENTIGNAGVHGTCRQYRTQNGVKSDASR
jgi:hypothetical protein